MGGFIAVCIASNGYAQLVDFYPNIIKYNVTQTVSIEIKIKEKRRKFD